MPHSSPGNYQPSRKPALIEAQDHRYAAELATVPDGMSWAEFRSHPVRQILRDAAYFGDRAVPSPAELAALRLPDGITQEIDMLARQLIQIHNSGDHQAAWQQAENAAADVLSDLAPRDREHPDLRSNVPDPLDDLTPGELAQYVADHNTNRLDISGLADTNVGAIA